MDFNKGIKDGIPIALGYFSVSIAFGIMAVEAGCTWFEAVLISLTNLTSAGQFAGVTVITHMGSFIEMALMQFVVNSRYGLMGIALSQKVNSRFKGIWRIILGFAITDEIFAVAIGQDSQTGGTLVGAVMGNIMPAMVTSALGLALYGMFIAVVVPKTREDKHVLIAVVIAVAISVAFRYIPVFSGISAGFAIIICAVAASAAGALLFPVKEDDQ